MQIRENVLLAPLTSFQVGGSAEQIAKISKIEEIKTDSLPEHFWVLSGGTNCVISDSGLPGLVLHISGRGKITVDDQSIIADSATSWDDVVKTAIDNNLWGIELMSAIPGNVGAALLGNIAAYGQKFADVFEWAEILNRGKVRRLETSDVDFEYRKTNLQAQKDLLVLRVGLKLASQPTTEIVYSKALDAAKDLSLTPNSLNDRRKIITEARSRAGAIYNPIDPDREKTAGSFFKNPLVDAGQAIELAKFEEFGKSASQISSQNKVHGGDQQRISASHVLLAAGFKRGQSWGAVRLHPQHILKIENTGGATASQIYDVAHEIMTTVKQKLGIELEPEVKFLGQF